MIDAIARIEQLCRERGITITYLEEKILNVSRGSLKKSGSIKSDNLIRLSKYFSKSVDYLLTGKEFNMPEMTDDEFRLLYMFRGLGKESQDLLLSEATLMGQLEKDLQKRLLEELERNA